MEDHTEYKFHEFPGTRTFLKASLGLGLYVPGREGGHSEDGRSSRRVRAGGGVGKLFQAGSRQGNTQHSLRFCHVTSSVFTMCTSTSAVYKVSKPLVMLTTTDLTG